MRGTTPAVETVTRRGAIAKAFGIEQQSGSPRPPLARFSSGSPIPMNTTFVMRRPSGSSASHAARPGRRSRRRVRLRARPIAPVAQNEHASGQPTCVETHSVVRSLLGNQHRLDRAPSRVTSAAFSVPSTESSTGRARAARERRKRRQALAQLAPAGRSSRAGSSTPRAYSQLRDLIGAIRRDAFRLEAGAQAGRRKIAQIRAPRAHWTRRR